MDLGPSLLTPTHLEQALRAPVRDGPARRLSNKVLHCGVILSSQGLESDASVLLLYDSSRCEAYRMRAKFVPE